jgi:magnesium chelatase family protein
VFGVDAFEVEIEVNAGAGNPVIVVVGLPDVAVKESKDRVTTAVQNSGFRWPRGRTTINLAPADVKKEGPSFDLPIALGMIACAEERELPFSGEFCFVGELALNGAIRPVRGVLSIAIEARKRGRKKLIVPAANAREAAMVEGIEVYGVANLREVYEFLTGDKPLLPLKENVRDYFTEHQNYEVDFSEVRGQHHAKRAIEVAVAGGHNLLMLGPPGSGKSMIAKRIPTIMPPMTLEEAIETTKIHSVCGQLDAERALVTVRPFRAPHNTISDIGLLGGGAIPAPGEISVAHNGVLFLDELPEFKRSTLEVLRQPLEDSKVTVTRASGAMTFPTDFILVAALNPCPCGFFGDPKRECRCSLIQVQRYRNRISGPLLDRIDIQLEVPAAEFREVASKQEGEKSATIRERIVAVRKRQTERFARSKVRCNARMSSKMVRAHCQLDDASEELLRLAMQQLGLSARAYDRILKVARTIADLADSETIQSDHIGEAIQYRTLDRNLWG